MHSLSIIIYCCSFQMKSLMTWSKMKISSSIYFSRTTGQSWMCPTKEPEACYHINVRPWKFGVREAWMYTSTLKWNVPSSLWKESLSNLLVIKDTGWKCHWHKITTKTNGQEKCLIFKTFTDIIFYMAIWLLLTMYICDKQRIH